MTNSTNNIPLGPQPENNLVLAIFTTVCFCLPLGIIAIIKANKVKSYYLMNQYELSVEAASDAKKWSYIGIAVGLFINLINLIVYLTGAA